MAGPAPRTRKDYGLWLDRIDAEFGDAPKAAFNHRRSGARWLKWRGQWKGRQSDHAWQIVKGLVSWAVDAGELEHHHLLRGKKHYKADRRDKLWSPEEIGATEAVAPQAIRDVVVMMRCTGLSPIDLCSLTVDQVVSTPLGRRIFRRRKKTGQIVGVPLLPKAAEIVDRVPPGRELVLLSERGKPWTPQNMSKRVKDFARKADVRDELHFYDLRGNAYTMLLAAGCSLGEISLFMG